MVVDAVQGYVNLVTGVTRATRARAWGVARGLAAQVGLEDAADGASDRVGRLAEEIVRASRANRELLENLVAAEVTRAATRWGFVRSDDLDEVREEIAELRAQLRRQEAAAPAPADPVRTAPADPLPAPAAPEPVPAPDPTTEAGA